MMDADNDTKFLLGRIFAEVQGIGQRFDRMEAKHAADYAEMNHRLTAVERLQWKVMGGAALLSGFIAFAAPFVEHFFK